MGESARDDGTGHSRRRCRRAAGRARASDVGPGPSPAVRRRRAAPRRTRVHARSIPRTSGRPVRRARGLARARIVLKRVFDASLAAGGLVVSAPLWAVFAAAIKLEDGGPIFYRQARVGLGGRRFDALKFRSMRPDAE